MSIVLIVFNLGFASHLITNGDFEADLRTGWLQDFGLPTALDSIMISPQLDSDPDNEVIVAKYNASSAKLYQTVTIPTLDLQFSCQALLYVLEHSPSSETWAASAIILRYLNSSNNLLGQTRIVNKSPNCTWSNSGTNHLIVVTDTANWHDYSFNLNNELNNLSGVNRSNIRKVQVAIIDTTNGC